MRGKIAVAGLILGLSATFASAQDNKAPTAIPDDVNCAGIVTTESVPNSTYVITGEQSSVKITFDEGDIVYVNKGGAQGAHVGEEFQAVRAIKDPYGIEWTKWQNSIMKKMGTVWEDEARVKLIVVQENVSIGKVEHSCQYVQRGDVLLPYTEREIPTLKSGEKFDRFAPPDGKALAMVISSKNFQSQVGKGDIVYVNLGNMQGVHVGDYFRVFRYQGTQHETAYQTPRAAFDQEFGMAVPDAGIYGFGAANKKWDWNNVPREVLGEGLVLRTGPNSSTVLLTFTLREVYVGDYVEIE
jgi:hypothetical protein